MSRRIIVVQEELEQIIDRLDKIEQAVRIRQKIPEHTFFDNQEFLQIMNVSKRTAQSWRDSRVISYSQVGSKIYYRMDDIQNILNKYYKSLKEQNNVTNNNKHHNY